MMNNGYGLTSYENFMRELVGALGCVTDLQIKKAFALAGYTQLQAEKAMYSLDRKRMVFIKDEKYYLPNPKTEVSFRKEEANWLYLRMLKKLAIEDLRMLFKAEEPSQLIFLLNNSLYEVAVLNEDEMDIMLLLDKKYKSFCANGSDERVENDQKYMHAIILPNESCLENIPDVSFDYIVAIITNEVDGHPNFTFYQK